MEEPSRENAGSYKLLDKEIQIMHRLFLVTAMYCQATSMNH